MHERVSDLRQNQSPQPDLNGATAVLAGRERPITAAGRSRTDEWTFRCDRRSRLRIDPMLSWTGGDGPSAPVELTFRSGDEAVRNERHGSKYRAMDRQTFSSKGRHSSVQDGLPGTVVLLHQLQDGYARCTPTGLPELERAFVNPAAVFASPDEVLRHPLLTIDCKREILWRWAWDEYLLDLANAEGMREGEPSRLPEVKAALRVLQQEWSPDPAAPAAFLIRYDVDGEALAA
jgi:hypothetical protein